MFRIGIIGSENSHAMAFSKIYNEDTPESRALNCRVVAIMGEEKEASQKVFDECGLEFIAEKAEDMLGKVDAIMVTSRNGALHLGYARPFVERGLPAFVDKPIANDAAEALTLVTLAKQSGSPLMGGSSTKLVPDTLSLKGIQTQLAAAGTALGGSVWAPLNMDNPYGGFYFYSAHLAEIAMTIFGYDPLSVWAERTTVGVDALLAYKSFDVALHFMDGAYSYGAVVRGRDSITMQSINIDDCYRLEAEEFAKMLASGQSSISHRELIQPIYLLNALEKSFQTGTKQAVEAANV